MVAFEAVIGLEIHAELLTRSKMFCSCPVVDSTQAEPNVAVCPICAGMPGTLPVINRQAVELALRVALALGCQIHPVSVFARKNYFYPDLPKGYQISQYEQPLAVNGILPIETESGWREIRIRRVHLEEDTGKLSHVHADGEVYSLVDLNRAGVPLLEIVSEPDLRSAQEVRAYAQTLRILLRTLQASSGDMEKGALRIEPNISVRPAGSSTLGTRVEIKNLNSFRSLERAVAYQIEVQVGKLSRGEVVEQETVGWDEAQEITFSQRSKEEAHDYRYFPEPDLPPLVVTPEWVESIRAALPELPWERQRRYVEALGLAPAEARLLVSDPALADFFDRVVGALKRAPARMAATWVTGELLARLNEQGQTLEVLRLSPEGFADLLDRTVEGQINLNTAKGVLQEMCMSGKPAVQIIAERGLEQVSDPEWIARIVAQVLRENPAELDKYRSGKSTLFNWFYGQVMRLTRGKANPQMVREELTRCLEDQVRGES
ncbi:MULTISPECIES: Asp-tRNA(Asn)/Glu-tRNA(Gln) amidotransferase subunit GatB [Anaerolinea]|uniref:Asp-tRNA(Asn)/Glu-tRNA(Gln) amidotransferase subunit GatB n=1 Tax=Anaerolinea TaxID=233189 RepID=UPI002628CA87|nr:Asp-tRNA(Asn)/Glu-tRNA(Gln) amidotransferase subunit GatB [Anaerolinea thermophila]